jgi:hypothetical protein
MSLASRSEAAPAGREGAQWRQKPCFKPFWPACGKSFLPGLVNKMAWETSSNDPFLVIAKYVQGAEISSEIDTWLPPLLGNA